MLDLREDIFYGLGVLKKAQLEFGQIKPSNCYWAFG